MIIKIPQNITWPQLNQGNLLGTLAMSRDIDLDTPGLLRLAPRTRVVAQTTTGNFVDTKALEFQGNQYWIASDRLFSMDADLTNFEQCAEASVPTTSINDMTVWNGALFVSDATRVSRRRTGFGWNTPFSDTDFDEVGTDFPHPVEPNVTNENLLVGDGLTLKKVSTAGVIETAITFFSGHRIKWIRRGANVNYIGLSPSWTSTETPRSRNGYVAIWDGLDTTLGYNSLIPLNCREALSAVVDDNGVLHIFTSDGRLMYFNGTNFSYKAELAPFRSPLARRSWGGTLDFGRKVFQRGMQVIRGRIHVVINAVTTDQIMQPEFQSGVYVYDEANQAFYHKYAPSNSATITDFGQSVFSTGPSALLPLVESDQTDSEPDDAVGSRLLFGGRLYPNTIGGTALRTLVSATTGVNRGQFATVRIESQDITDNNLFLWCKYQGLNTANDKIVFKYRNSQRDPFVLTSGVPTWTSSTVFTTTDTKMADAEVGDEITILSGNGAGSTAHITIISENAGTYTVTLDEAITGISASDTAWIMVENWTRLPDEITYTDTEGYKKIQIEARKATTIELKGELRGEGGVVAIKELSLVKKGDIPIE